MNNNLIISGFSDEISADFSKQLETVKSLGMSYISLRAADGINISNYTLQMVCDKLLPQLSKHGVCVSSLGSPIGKIKIDDEEAFDRQLAQLEELCKIANKLNCKYIRIFSFYIPAEDDFDKYENKVIAKLEAFVKIAEKYKVILLHENEKEIYGDIAKRCENLFKAIKSPCFKAAFDYANFVQCGEDTEKAWEMLKAYVVYIHIKDAVYSDSLNVLCGTGDGKIQPLLKKAVDGGYKGFLTLEPHLYSFDSFRGLEKNSADSAFKASKAGDGAQAYEMQYNALLGILKNIL